MASGRVSAGVGCVSERTDLIMSHSADQFSLTFANAQAKMMHVYACARVSKTCSSTKQARQWSQDENRRANLNEFRRQ